MKKGSIKTPCYENHLFPSVKQHETKVMVKNR